MRSDTFPTIPEPYRTEVLTRLMVAVKPLGGVWINNERLFIRYLPYGDPQYTSWAEAAVITGVEVPGMEKRIAELITRAKARSKPARKQAKSANRLFEDRSALSLTTEQIEQANREAREWHEREQGYTKGLGRYSA